MVSDKTASLFSASCNLGAMTITKNLDKRKALSEFGENFGLVFQIKDDLLDITGNVEGLGKPSGFDLKKNIITLPLILLFKSLDASTCKKVKRQLKNHVKRSELIKIRDLIEEYGGVELAESKIKSLSKEAIMKLDIFPDSIYKDSLVSTLEYNFDRKK